MEQHPDDYGCVGGTTADTQEARDANNTLHRDHPEGSKLYDSIYQKEFHENGIAGMKKQLRKYLDNWSTIELHTAVIGNSGTGKSSFINSITRFSAEHPLAAQVGCIGSTTTRKAYKHPDNRSFLTWDLPGAGTDKYPRHTYLEAIEFEQFDFFILMSKSRLTEADSWLAAEIQKLNKKCFLIRSNIDTDIYNDKCDHPNKHNEQKLLKTFRTESENMLKKHGVRVPQVFLISNIATDKYDFGKLNDALLSSCDGLKKDAITLSLTKGTKNVIIEKKKALKQRIPCVALSVVSRDRKDEQKAVFQEEIICYQKQFGIDDFSLAECTDILDLSDERIEGYRVVFDETPSGKQMAVTTPTALREDAATWDRFVDWFRWSKENKLLYKYSISALEQNLDILYKQACILYDISTVTEIVKTVLR